MIKDAAFCRYMYEENVRCDRHLLIMKSLTCLVDSNCEKQITALHDIFKYLQDEYEPFSPSIRLLTLVS